MEWFETDLLPIALFWTWAVCGAVQLFIYICIYFPLGCRCRKSVKRKKQTPAGLPPVSVIVYAHNDCARLAEVLPLLLEQQYPDFEVVVVDNASKDETSSLLLRLQQRYPHLRFTGIKDEAVFANTAHFAMTIGVKAARNEFLLVTDAHCRPEGPHWIEHMHRCYHSGTGFVVGCSQYGKRPGLLNLLVRYERFCLAAMGFGLSLSGKPCLAFGGNLAYRRSIFFANQGFAHIAHIPVGNIPVFVPELARRRATVLALHSDAFVCEEPPSSWNEWRRIRRIRRASERVKGAGRLRFFRTMELLTRLLFYGLAVWLLVSGVHWEYVAGGLLLRLLVQTGVLVPLMRRLHVYRMGWWLPLLDLILQPLTLLVLGLSGGQMKSGGTVGMDM